MVQDRKQCQKCQAEFLVEKQDLAFYVSMAVPEPTLCPECRLARRLCWINFRSLYQRKLEIGGGDVISMYSPEKPFVIMNDHEWWDDSFDARSYGRPYDFARSFFDQYRDLLRTAPLPHLHRDFCRMQNSEYCNAATGLKNCYLCMAADEAEDTYYSFKITKLVNCVDVAFTDHSELCGNSVGLTQCYNVHFSRFCENSNNIYFSSDCSGCNDCVGCINLKNSSYCIFNVPYPKEEYTRLFRDMRLDTAGGIASLAPKAEQFFRTQPHRYMRGKNNVDVTGDYIYNSKNVRDSYAVKFSEDCRYVHSLDAIDARNADSYDWSQFGIGSERIYESAWCGLQCNTIRFSFWNYYAHDLTYCFGCHSSDNCFGCVGVRKKRYCILNAQYTKEEYEALVPKIIAHMHEMPYTDGNGIVYRYGEFFPSELSPFGYNETEAYDHLPLTKESAVVQGYQWYDQPKREVITGAIPSANIADSIDDISDDISKQTFVCSTFTNVGEGALQRGCTGYYRFIVPEVAWYKQRNLPLPRACPRCRYRERLALQPLFRSYSRSCMCERSADHAWHSNDRCAEAFVTSYAPHEQEPIYCKKCYSAVVY